MKFTTVVSYNPLLLQQSIGFDYGLKHSVGPLLSIIFDSFLDCNLVFLEVFLLFDTTECKVRYEDNVIQVDFGVGGETKLCRILGYFYLNYRVANNSFKLNHGMIYSTITWVYEKYERLLL